MTRCLIRTFLLVVLLLSQSLGGACHALTAASAQESKEQFRNQVRSLYYQGKIEEAIALVEKRKADKSDAALQGAEYGYLIPATLAVLYLGKKPLIYSLPEAKSAVKLKPQSAVLRTNYGLLLQRNGERANAVEQFRKATQLDPSDWRPRVGIAQCLACDGVDGRLIAEKEMKLAVATASDTKEKWSILGRTYLVLRKYKDASYCFSRMLKLKADDFAGSCLSLKADLLEHRETGTPPTLLSSLLPVVLSPQLADQELAVLLSSTSTLSDGDHEKLLDIARVNFIGSDQTYYQMGRAFEDLNKLTLARAAYEEALKNAPQNSCYKLSLVGNRVLAQDNAAAVAYLERFSPAQTGSEKIQKTVPRSYRDAFASALKVAPQLVMENPDSAASSLKLMRAVYHKINCGCRLAVIEYKLRMLPGVVFANLLDLKEPPLTVIYDAKETKADTIIGTAKRDDDVFEVLADEPVKSFSELVKIVQKASDKIDKHIFSIWSFEAPPLELP